VKNTLADFLSTFYFAHFLSSELAPIGVQKKRYLWLVGPKNISTSTIVIFNAPLVMVSIGALKRKIAGNSNTDLHVN
jgi:hypothetical protein